MKHGILRPACVVLSIVALSQGGAAGQTSGPAGKASGSSSGRAAHPRTPWGDPDLQGTWSSDDSIGVPIQRPDQFGARPELNDEEFADRTRGDQEARQRALVDRIAPSGGAPGGAVGPPDHWGERGSRTAKQTSLIVDPADGKIPALTPQAQLRAAGRDTGSFGAGPFNGPEDLTNYDRCITRGVVGSLIARPYGNGLQIVQSPGYVAIRHEMIHEARVIPLGSHPHVGPHIRQYMGDARGRWDGDTLVIDTTNFTDRTSIGLNGNGLRHSDAMHLVERYTRVTADTIRYEVTIDDPKTYTRPWTMTFPLTTQPGYQVFEYACHEGNYGIRNILSAARAEQP